MRNFAYFRLRMVSERFGASRVVFSQISYFFHTFGTIQKRRCYMNGVHERVSSGGAADLELRDYHYAPNGLVAGSTSSECILGDVETIHPFSVTSESTFIHQHS